MSADSVAAEQSGNNNDISSHEEKWHHLKGGVFLASVTGISILFGFSMALAAAKKRDPQSFGKGLDPFTPTSQLENGASLALRALGRGTLYSVSGFGLFCLVTWKLMGVNNLQEFREKVRSMMPKVPKSKSEGRSDFKSIRELVTYFAEERSHSTITDSKRINAGSDNST